MRIELVIPGEPVGKGRARFGNGRTYTPDKTADYEDLVRLIYKTKCKNYRFPDKAPLSMEIRALYGIGKSIKGTERQARLDGRVLPTKTPDTDNIAKIIADSLNKIAYHDDAQIVQMKVSKSYSATPCVFVIIEDAAPCSDAHN